jgi:hypothetical protein
MRKLKSLVEEVRELRSVHAAHAAARAKEGGGGAVAMSRDSGTIDEIENDSLVFDLSSNCWSSKYKLRRFTAPLQCVCVCVVCVCVVCVVCG